MISAGNAMGIVKGQISSGHDGIRNRRRDKNGQRENISDELFQDISFAGE